LIRDVELDGVGVCSDALCGCLPVFEAARPDKHGQTVRREILGDLKADALIGPGDQGDEFVLHNALLFAMMRGR